eukprot:4317131-Prorocentrum_lima.AAC.1
MPPLWPCRGFHDPRHLLQTGLLVPATLACNSTPLSRNLQCIVTRGRDAPGQDQARQRCSPRAYN